MREKLGGSFSRLISLSESGKKHWCPGLILEGEAEEPNFFWGESRPRQVVEMGNSLSPNPSANFAGLQGEEPRSKTVAPSAACAAGCASPGTSERRGTWLESALLVSKAFGRSHCWSRLRCRRLWSQRQRMRVMPGGAMRRRPESPGRRGMGRVFRENLRLVAACSTRTGSRRPTARFIWAAR